jgi:hypothetical protein
MSSQLGETSNLLLWSFIVTIHVLKTNDVKAFFLETLQLIVRSLEFIARYPHWALTHSHFRDISSFLWQMVY